MSQMSFDSAPKSEEPTLMGRETDERSGVQDDLGSNEVSNDPHQASPIAKYVPPFPPSKTDKPKPHICLTCTRGFARLEHLKRHERSHTKEKPFACNECARCFARRDLLLRHQQKLHQAAPPSSARGGAARRRQSASSSLASGAKIRKNSTSTNDARPGPSLAGPTPSLHGNGPLMHISAMSGGMRPRANTISHVDRSTLSMIAASPALSRQQSAIFAATSGVPEHTMEGMHGTTSDGFMDLGDLRLQPPVPNTWNNLESHRPEARFNNFSQPLDGFRALSTHDRSWDHTYMTGSDTSYQDNLALLSTSSPPSSAFCPGPAATIDPAHLHLNHQGSAFTSSQRIGYQDLIVAPYGNRNFSSLHSSHIQQREDRGHPSGMSFGDALSRPTPEGLQVTGNEMSAFSPWTMDSMDTPFGLTDDFAIEMSSPSAGDGESISAGAQSDFAMDGISSPSASKSQAPWMQQSTMQGSLDPDQQPFSGEGSSFTHDPSLFEDMRPQACGMQQMPPASEHAVIFPQTVSLSEDEPQSPEQYTDLSRSQQSLAQNSPLPQHYLVSPPPIPLPPQTGPPPINPAQIAPPSSDPSSNTMYTNLQPNKNAAIFAMSSQQTYPSNDSVYISHSSPIVTISQKTRDALVLSLTTARKENSSRLDSSRPAPMEAAPHLSLSQGPGLEHSSWTFSETHNSVPQAFHLQSYIDAYIRHFHPHMPFLHIGTFSFELDPNSGPNSDLQANYESTDQNDPNIASRDTAGSKGALLLAMAAIGALCEGRSEISLSLFHDTKEFITHLLHERHLHGLSSSLNYSLQPSPDHSLPQFKDTLRLIQAMLLNVICGYDCGDSETMDIARTHHATLVSLARSSGLMTEMSSSFDNIGINSNGIFHSQPDTVSSSKPSTTHDSCQDQTHDQQLAMNSELEQLWLSWSDREERKRTLFAIFNMSTLLVCAYNRVPAITNSEIKLSLPCDEDRWSAKSAAEWYGQGGTDAAKGACPSFATALSLILTADQRHQAHSARNLPTPLMPSSYNSPTSSDLAIPPFESGLNVPSSGGDPFVSSSQNAASPNTPSSTRSLELDRALELDLRPSTFGCLVLINALHNHLWETQQRGPDQSWLASNVGAMQSKYVPALRAWQSTWSTHSTHSLERPNPFGASCLSADCIPLLDLAYLRLHLRSGQVKDCFYRGNYDALAHEISFESVDKPEVSSSDASKASTTNNSAGNLENIAPVDPLSINQKDMPHHFDGNPVPGEVRSAGIDETNRDDTDRSLNPTFRHIEKSPSSRELYLRHAALCAVNSLRMSHQLNVTFADFNSRELPLQSALCAFDCVQVLAEWLTTIQVRLLPVLGIIDLQDQTSNQESYEGGAKRLDSRCTEFDLDCAVGNGSLCSEDLLLISTSRTVLSRTYEKLQSRARGNFTNAKAKSMHKMPLGDVDTSMIETAMEGLTTRANSPSPDSSSAYPMVGSELSTNNSGLRPAHPDADHVGASRKSGDHAGGRTGADASLAIQLLTTQARMFEQEAVWNDGSGSPSTSRSCSSTD